MAEFVGPLEHLIGNRYRSKTRGLEGNLNAIGCGYFMVCKYAHFETHVEVHGADGLAKEWELAPE